MDGWDCCAALLLGSGGGCYTILYYEVVWCGVQVWYGGGVDR
jgi:hypothetical protein